MGEKFFYSLEEFKKKKQILYGAFKKYFLKINHFPKKFLGRRFSPPKGLFSKKPGRKKKNEGNYKTKVFFLG